MTALDGSRGSPAAIAVAVTSIDSRSAVVRIGGPGVSANGTLLNTPPLLGSRSTTTTSVGAAGSSHSMTVTDPKPRRSGSSVRPTGAGGSYSAYISRLSSPAAIDPYNRTHRCGFFAFGGMCQSVSISVRPGSSTMKTSVLSAHSSTGLLIRSKWPHQNGLSSRRWYPRAAATIAMARCSGVRATRSSPQKRASRRARSSSISVGPVSRTGCEPRGGTPDSMARAISQSRNLWVDRQS